MADQGKGRIAIKLGGNSTAAKQSRTNPPSSLGKRPRSKAWGGSGSDSEPDDDDRNGRHEAITGFGAHGAETANKKRDLKAEQKQFVIERQPNRDWRSDVKAQRRGKDLLPEEARAQQNGTTVETEPADQDKGIQWGLTIKEKRIEEDTKDARQAETEKAEASTPGKPDSEHKVPEPRTADDDAMDALLGKAPEKPLAVIQSEEDAYRRDVETAGAASTLEDYEAMPVEEFGAALLRGMGWDGKSRGSKPKEVRRRPNRLGLGAKELKEDEDLGGWNQKGKKPRPPRLNDYRREEDKRKESRRRDGSYKSERDRERDRSRDGHRDRYRESDRDYDRRRDRHGDYGRDRR